MTVVIGGGWVQGGRRGRWGRVGGAPGVGPTSRPAAADRERAERGADESSDCRQSSRSSEHGPLQLQGEHLQTGQDMVFMWIYLALYNPHVQAVFMHVSCLGVSYKSVAVLYPYWTAFALRGCMLSRLGTATYSAACNTIILTLFL